MNYRDEFHYNNKEMTDTSIDIRDEGDFRSLYFADDQLQSRMSLSTPQDLVLAYTRCMVFPLLTRCSPKNILIIGLGSGSFVRFFHHHFPACHIDAVDYSLEVIKIAKGYFMLPESDKINISHADGFAYLQNQSKKEYDLILVDAFDDNGMSPTIYSERFLRGCSRQLTPTGCLCCNLWSNDAKRLKEIKSILQHYFTGKIYLPVPNRGNIAAIAFTDEVPWNTILHKKKAVKELTKKYGIDFRQLLKIAIQANMSFSKRISNIFN